MSVLVIFFDCLNYRPLLAPGATEEEWSEWSMFCPPALSIINPELRGTSAKIRRRSERICHAARMRSKPSVHPSIAAPSYQKTLSWCSTLTTLTFK